MARHRPPLRRPRHQRDSYYSADQMVEVNTSIGWHVACVVQTNADASVDVSRLVNETTVQETYGNQSVRPHNPLTEAVPSIRYEPGQAVEFQRPGNNNWFPAIFKHYLPSGRLQIQLTIGSRFYSCWPNRVRPVTPVVPMTSLTETREAVADASDIVTEAVNALTAGEEDQEEEPRPRYIANQLVEVRHGRSRNWVTARVLRMLPLTRTVRVRLGYRGTGALLSFDLEDVRIPQTNDGNNADDDEDDEGDEADEGDEGDEDETPPTPPTTRMKRPIARIGPTYVYRLRFEQLDDQESGSMARALVYAHQFNWQVERQPTTNAPIALMVPRKDLNKKAGKRLLALHVYEEHHITDWRWKLNETRLTSSHDTSYGKPTPLYLLDLDGFPVTRADLKESNNRKLVRRLCENSYDFERRANNGDQVIILITGATIDPEITPDMFANNTATRHGRINGKELMFYQQGLYLTSLERSSGLFDLIESIPVPDRDLAGVWAKFISGHIEKQIDINAVKLAKLRQQLMTAEQELAQLVFIRNATGTAADTTFNNLLDKIRSIPGFLSVACYTTHIRIVTEAVWWISPDNHKRYFFGQYELYLYFQDGIKFRNLQQPPDGYPHPHAGRGGDSCLGGFFSLLTSCYRSMDYYNAALVAWEFLRSMTSTDNVAYGRLPTFSKPPSELHKAGLLVNLFAADSTTFGGTAHDEDDEEG